MKGKIDGVPNQMYQVNVEVMNTGIPNDPFGSGYKILIGCGPTFKDRIGLCQPTRALSPCAYYDCARKNQGMSLYKEPIVCSDGKFEIEILYPEQKETYSCMLKNNVVSAVARVTLTPLEG